MQWLICSLNRLKQPLELSGSLSALVTAWAAGCRQIRHPSAAKVLVQAMGSSKGTPLKDVVDVTMEVSAGTPGYAAAVRDQLAALINGKSYLDVSSRPYSPLLCCSCTMRAPSLALEQANLQDIEDIRDPQRVPSIPPQDSVARLPTAILGC